MRLHHQGGKMLLVPKDIHGLAHMGSASLTRASQTVDNIKGGAAKKIRETTNVVLQKTKGVTKKIIEKGHGATVKAAKVAAENAPEIVKSMGKVGKKILSRLPGVKYVM